MARSKKIYKQNLRVPYKGHLVINHVIKSITHRNVDMTSPYQRMNWSLSWMSSASHFINETLLQDLLVELS